MTEAEWLSTTKPQDMESFLRVAGGRERKRLLIGPGCCRLAWGLLPDPRSRLAVEAAEHWADRPGARAHTLTDTRVVYEAAELAEAQWPRGSRLASTAHAARSCLIRCLNWHEGRRWENNVGDIMLHVRDAEDDYHGSWGRYVIPSDPEYRPDHPAQADLLRCIFGNPFRPVAFSPTWITGTALSLAQGMYESRDFSAMPILADALQDAGCDSAEVLDHCRDPKGAHARGCWVVDLVLGNV